MVLVVAETAAKQVQAAAQALGESCFDFGVVVPAGQDRVAYR
jgi:hypothetical protein